jgi:hypothetical protein
MDCGLDQNYIIPLQLRWEVYQFSWGSAIKDTRLDKWVTAFISPDAQEIDLQHLNIKLHDNGIEFL